MANKAVLDFEVVENRHIHRNFSLLILQPENADVLNGIRPGQFVQVRIDNSPSTFLRRPISVNFIDRKASALWLLIRNAGAGTEILTSLLPGQMLNLIVGLGNGFSMPKSKREPVLLVGGGVGVAPLLYFGAILQSEGYRPEFLLGARTGLDLLEVDLFRRYGRVHLSTDDGSVGERGVITSNPALRERYQRIYCCGPVAMMKAVAKKARALDVACEVSLENMMACGIGACLCCVEKTVKGNVCVCTEGPVFDIKELTW